MNPVPRLNWLWQTGVFILENLNSVVTVEHQNNISFFQYTARVLVSPAHLQVCVKKCCSIDPHIECLWFETFF